MCTQGCEPKVVFFGPLFVFLPTKNCNFLGGFSVAQKKRNRKTDSFFTVGFVLQPTAAKKLPKPTEIFGEKPKTDRAIFTFGLFSVQNPVRHMIPTDAHWIHRNVVFKAVFIKIPTEKCLVSVSFLSVEKKNCRKRPTFRWKNEKPTEAIFIFGSQPCVYE